MFVRIERRMHVGAHAPLTRFHRLKRPWESLVVSIAESRWADGQPRQRIVQYVGTIRIDDVHLPSARREFWDRAAERLEQFTPEARQRFENVIAAKIARPPAEPSFAQKIEAARARLAAFRAERVGLGADGGEGREEGPARRVMASD